MNRRYLPVAALCGGLLAAAAFVPTAQAGNVAWGVSIGLPGFGVVAGQPGYYGGRGYYGGPYRPYYRPWYRAAVVAPPVAYVAPPVAYYAPAPVVYAPRRVVYGPTPLPYVYPGYGAPTNPYTSSY
jgi:hypothetical protein